ncbi:hypothetical protein D3C79_968840 [compost metagenome]
MAQHLHQAPVAQRIIDDETVETGDAQGADGGGAQGHGGVGAQAPGHQDFTLLARVVGHLQALRVQQLAVAEQRVAGQVVG